LNIRKFVAASNREALRLVRDALGVNAVVLSNRVLDDGSVEITALAESELASISPHAQGGGMYPVMGTLGDPAVAGSDAAHDALSYGAQSYAGGAYAPFGTAGADDDDDDDDVALSTNLGGTLPALKPTVPMAPAPLGQPSDSPSALRPGAGQAGASESRPGAGLGGTSGSRSGAGQAGASGSRSGAGQGGRPGSRSGAGQAGLTVSRPGSGQSSKSGSRPTFGQPPASGAHPLPDAYASKFGAFPEPEHEQEPARMPANAARSRAADAALQATRAELSAPGTLGAANQWLLEHAVRASQNVPRNAPLTPSLAAARGLGAPGERALLPKPVAQSAATLSPHPEMPFQASAAPAAGAAMRGAQPGAAHVVPADPASVRAASSVSASGAGATPTAAVELSEPVQTRIAELVNQQVCSELSSMRTMMEEQFAGLLWSDRQRANPVHAEISKRLFSAGFSAQLVRMMLERLPEDKKLDEALAWARSTLESNIPVIEDEDALMEQGGVFALMGPTGVGKTTTTAKLAARCVMRFGASKVALLTTDSYRIGAHEQLRIYGKILGVSVHAVKDAADLRLALSELRNKHIVLIDTIGMSQRDRAVSDQIAMLTGAGQQVKRLLLLNATAHGDTLNEIVQAYRHAPDGQASSLAGCILTKLDEATNLGSAIDTVIRYKLPVHYVSTGQKVPENLYIATRRFLIKSVFCIPRDGSPFVPQEEDLPVLLSALSARSTAEMHEVNFG